MAVFFYQSELLKNFNLDEKRIKNFFFEAENCVFADKKIKDKKVSAIFVDEDYIKVLNKKFLGQNGSTDVIAFPFFEKDYFGEIYICLEEAKKNAKKFRENLEKEVLRLFIHGCLHLKGFRDYKKNERDKMWAIQEAILKKVMQNAN